MSIEVTILLIILITILWIISGFISFFMQIKRFNGGCLFSSFDDNAKFLLTLDIVLGFIMFIGTFICILIIKFNEFMDKYIKNMNNKH